MGSLFRRSGVGVGFVAEAIGWKADTFVQVGTGMHFEELDVLIEAWKLQQNCIMGFEANPRIYQSIKDKYPGTLINVAVSDQVGRTFIYNKKSHADGSSLYPFIKEERVEKLEIGTDTIDNMVPGLFDRHILYWVDCEGHELNVLRGSVEFIKKVEVVNIEMSMNPPGIGWCDPDDVHQWLVDHGFYAVWVHTHKIGSGQIDYVYVKPHLFKPEFCCFPWERQRFKCQKTT